MKIVKHEEIKIPEDLENPFNEIIKLYVSIYSLEKEIEYSQNYNEDRNSYTKPPIALLKKLDSIKGKIKKQLEIIDKAFIARITSVEIRK